MMRHLMRLGLVGIGLMLVGPWAGGKELTPKDAGFSVDMPGDAIETKQALGLPTGGKVEVKIFLVQLKADTNYIVSYCDLPAESLQGLTPDARLDRARDDAVAASKGKLVSDKKVKLGTDPGRDVVIELPEDKGFVRDRIYLVKTRLYQLVVTGDKGLVMGADAEKYLDSFKLTGGS